MEIQQPEDPWIQEPEDRTEGPKYERTVHVHIHQWPDTFRLRKKPRT